MSKEVPMQVVLHGQGSPVLYMQGMSEVVRPGSMGSALWVWYSPEEPREVLPGSRPAPAAARARPGLTGSFMSMLRAEVRLLNGLLT